MNKQNNEFLLKTSKHNALTENLALAHSSTGDVLADQFSKAGSFRGRPMQEVFADQSALHNYDAQKALQFVFYLRMVTRKTYISGEKTEKVQRGQGQRDEAFKRYLWYAVNFPEVFYQNIWLFPVVGRYQDVFDILWYAHKAGIKLQASRILGGIITYAINSESQDLFKKYLPLKDSSPTTDRSKFMNSISDLIKNMMRFDNHEELRKYKVSGEAHVWQQKISQQRFHEINFGDIPGKALHNLVTSDFLENQGLEDKYEKWILDQPIAKFTGYPYELGNKFNHNDPYYKRVTYDKQFEGLIELAKEDEEAIEGNVWCALDTSGSMQSSVGGGVTDAITVAKSLAIYFSTLNEGAFHKNVIMFDSSSRVGELSGSFTQMWEQIPLNAMGSTNFQSVVDEIVRIRQRYPDVPLKDYPQTILVVSDMQFNPTVNSTVTGWGSKNRTTPGRDRRTNHEEQMRKLREVFPEDWVEDFKVVWWDCTGRVTDNQPTHIDEGGTYVFSGWDGAVISLLLGGDQQQEEGEEKTLMSTINDVLSQEVLQHVRM